MAAGWLALAAAVVANIDKFTGSHKTTTEHDETNTTGKKSTVDSGFTTIGLQENSGHTDTTSSDSTTSGRIDTSSIINSGSVDVGQTGASKNVTTNTGAENVTTGTVHNSGSQNVITDSDRVNTTSTSGRVDTSQLLLTQPAIDHIIKGIFEGNQGLAAVSGGQKTTGGYDSTTNTQLINDLLSRTSGEVAARSAITQNITGGTTTTQTIGGGTRTEVIGGSDTTNLVDQILGGSSITQNIGAITNMQTHGPSVSNTTTNIGGTTSHTDGTTTVGASEVMQANVTGPRVLLEDSTSQTIADKEVHEDKKGIWIICTELYKQGRLPHKYYIPGSRRFASYDERGKQGYYIWAVPSVHHLRKHPYSLYSRFLCSAFNHRAEYIAAQSSAKLRARKTIRGFLALVGFYAVCWTLSRTLVPLCNYQFNPTCVYGD